MRNLFPFLITVAIGVLGFFLLLPILSIFLVIVAGIILLVLAAPLLMRLPWFRKRIIVHRSGNFTSMRFGKDAYTTYDGQPPQAEPARQRLNYGDVIDVEGRELPADDESAKKRD